MEGKGNTDRLTRKSDTSDMVWFIDREHKSGYAEREPCDMGAHHARLAIAKLAEYEDLEEQGKLLRLPCAIGDIVYWILGTDILQMEIEYFQILPNKIKIFIQILWRRRAFRKLYKIYVRE